MTKSPPDRATILAWMNPLTEIAQEAGRAILAVDRTRMGALDKSDGSPVTDADFAADRLIAAGLARIAPDIPVVSEERAPPFCTPYEGAFFLVDPLDGTKEYIAGHSDYGVNIALIVAGEPVLGVIVAPAIATAWRGAIGHGAERLMPAANGALECTAIATRPWPAANWIAAVSRTHGDPRTANFVASRPGGVLREMGSSLKFCRLAEGAADVYPRLAPTSEWDVAAGCAILLAAGGHVTDSKGQPLRFGQRPGSFLVPEFVAWGDPTQAAKP